MPCSGLAVPANKNNFLKREGGLDIAEINRGPDVLAVYDNARLEPSLKALHAIKTSIKGRTLVPQADITF
ncbi:hypothetical protein A0H81_12559 [Grifola frondosa]|uniref:Uncharacterized protein n=1 Tax=Grifola frondosa TaxID=5627 RepID=A0A1C7LTM9_GRIFR|nr:hypothetical protein A0H81_12559 [Grifola frondosa]